MNLISLICRMLGWRKKKKYLKLCTSQKNVKFGWSSYLYLLWNSNSSDILIGGNCMVDGSLISAYNGKIILGEYSAVGKGTVIRAVESVIIGPYTAISTGVVISDNNNHPIHPDDREIMRTTPPRSFERSWINSEHAPIIIGRNCWIGENSRICKGVVIGDGAIVAANAVVTKNVPANSIVAGNPGQIVKTDININTPRKFNK